MEVTPLKSRDINPCHEVAQAFPEPLGVCIVTFAGLHGPEAEPVQGGVQEPYIIPGLGGDAIPGAGQGLLPKGGKFLDH